MSPLTSLVPHFLQLRFSWKTLRYRCCFLNQPIPLTEINDDPYDFDLESLSRNATQPNPEFLAFLQKFHVDYGESELPLVEVKGTKNYGDEGFIMSDKEYNFAKEAAKRHLIFFVTSVGTQNVRMAQVIQDIVSLEAQGKYRRVATQTQWKVTKVGR